MDTDNSLNGEDKEKYDRHAKKQTDGQKAHCQEKYGQKDVGPKIPGQKARRQETGGQKAGSQAAGGQIRKCQKGSFQRGAGKEIRGRLKNIGEKSRRRQEGPNAKTGRPRGPPKIFAKGIRRPVRKIRRALRYLVIPSVGCRVNRRHLWVV